MRNLLLGLVVLLAVPAAAEEKHVSTDIHWRTALTFKVPDAAAQKLLPAGWEPAPATQGAGKGHNMTLSLAETVTAQDADGKPIPVGPLISVALAAKRIGTDIHGPVLVSMLGRPGLFPAADGIYRTAEVSVERHHRTGADAKSTVEEIWQAKAEDGSRLEFRLQFERGVAARTKPLQIKVYSAAKPDFYWLYRFELSADVLRSIVTGVDRVSRLEIKASGPVFDALLDGKQQLVSVESSLWLRSIHLPTM